MYTYLYRRMNVYTCIYTYMKIDMSGMYNEQNATTFALDF